MSNGTILLMRSLLDELAYSSVQIEGIASTFAQTADVMERGVAAGLDEGSLVKLLGIKHALAHLFAHHDEPLCWKLYARYNELVGEGSVPDAGVMRGPGEVVVDGFEPGEVSEVLFDDIVDTAVSTGSDASERASSMFLLLCRTQFFRDGNKRSAQMLVNHFLAHEDAGIALVVSESSRDAVLDLLVDFYHGSTSLQDAAWDLGELAIRSARGAALTGDRAWEDAILPRDDEGEETTMTEILERYVNMGLEQGLEQGLERGRQEGEELLGCLVAALIADGEYDLAARAATDPATRRELYASYGIEPPAREAPSAGAPER